MSATGERMIATKALRHKETRRFCRGEKSKGGYAEMIFGDGRHECTNRLMRINNSHLSKIKNKIRNSCIRGQAEPCSEKKLVQKKRTVIEIAVRINPISYEKPKLKRYRVGFIVFMMEYFKINGVFVTNRQRIYFPVQSNHLQHQIKVLFHSPNGMFLCLFQDLQER